MQLINHSKIHTILSVLILLVLFSCQNKQSEEKTAETATDSVTVFTPHPTLIAEQEVKILPIGAKAPDFSLPNVDGKFYSLKDFDQSDVLVIVFTCNHCPTAQAYEDRIIKFTNDYKGKAQVVAIMPNSVLGLLPEEGGYTDLNDSYEDMIIRAKDKKFNFPYLYDGDDQHVALLYGPSTTPHAFVFDKERKLQYVGRLDGSEKPGTADAEDLRSAVDTVLAGNTLATPVNKAFGCSVKWGWKNEYALKAEKEWKEKPVSVEKINAAGITDLVKNKSDKLRLINVWATWCAPCVAEYPDLLLLQRMYSTRDFEFISISADNPENENKVLNFLKNKYSSIPNYLYGDTDKYKLIESIDPNWDGALPYTILVEPGGKIAYSHQGSLDFLELKRAIVDHPMIGRYY